MATRAIDGLGGHPWLGWLALMRHRELIVAWTRRDMQVRYQGSFLGNAWAVLQPVAMLAIYTFVFSVVLNVRFGLPGHGGFAVFLLAGLLPWLAFSETALRASTVIPSNANLVKKVVFPLEALPASLTAAGLVNQLIGLAVLLAVVATMVGLKASLAWLPVLLAVQIALTLGVAWFLAGLGVFVRDLAMAMGLLLNVGLYLSPILYPASAVPEAWRWAFAYNPIAFLVEGYRGAILEGVGPPVFGLLGHGALALLVMVLGWSFFARTRRAFADVL